LENQLSFPGTTDFEALLFIALGRSQADLVSFEKLLKLNIPDHLSLLREEARQLYFRETNMNDKTAIARSFLRLYSDSLMNNSTHRYAEEMTSAGHSVYLYNFTHCSADSFGPFAYRMPFTAATHCYELRYLFGKGMFSKFRPNYDDLQMLDLMTTMWTNFAKLGYGSRDIQLII
jgi:carboxylesterase type B